MTEQMSFNFSASSPEQNLTVHFSDPPVATQDKEKTEQLLLVIRGYLPAIEAKINNLSKVRLKAVLAATKGGPLFDGTIFYQQNVKPLDDLRNRINATTSATKQELEILKQDLEKWEATSRS